MFWIIGFIIGIVFGGVLVLGLVSNYNTNKVTLDSTDFEKILLGYLDSKKQYELGWHEGKDYQRDQWIGYLVDESKCHYEINSLKTDYRFTCGNLTMRWRPINFENT